MKVRVLEGHTVHYPVKEEHNGEILERWHLWREGDVFELWPRKQTIVDVKSQKIIGEDVMTVEQQFSENAMERVDNGAMLSAAPTSAQSALERHRRQRRNEMAGISPNAEELLETTKAKR